MSIDQTVVLFNKSWDIYRKVVDANYMHHKQFHELTREVIRKKSSTGPVSFLDLGCGDASQLVDIFQQVELESYVGYDLSATALNIAKENLSFLDGKAMFLEGRMEELLSENGNKYDMIYTSFAVHHLDDQLKAAMIEMVSEKLTHDGIFIYVDVFRKKEIERTEYINQYCDHMDNHWPLLSVDEKKSIREHVSQYDFPATVEFILEHTNASGLQNITCHSSDQVHYFMHFQK